MTYREFYTAVINANVNDEITTFATNAINKLDSTNKKRRETETPEQAKNSEIKAKILEYLTTANRICSAAEIAKAVEVSTNKSAALLSQLAKNDEIEVIDKFKAEGSKTKAKGYKAKEGV